MIAASRSAGVSPALKNAGGTPALHLSARAPMTSKLTNRNSSLSIMWMTKMLAIVALWHVDGRKSHDLPFGTSDIGGAIAS
jgi:hypothetical protein